MNQYSNDLNKKILVMFFLGLFIIVLGTIIGFNIIDKTKNPEVITISFEYPKHWDTDYTEDASAYDEIFAGAVVEDFYTNQNFDAVSTAATVSTSYSTKPNAMSSDDARIAMLEENEAWEFISDGIFTTYPSGSFASNKSKLVKLQQMSTKVITVDVWYWAYPDEPENMMKIPVTKKFAVNSKLANTFKHIFADIYNHPSQPVINVADKGMGTWVLRGKNHNSNNTMSAHSLGCAIDINPSTGSFKINDVWYGNGYKHKPMPESVWNQLPECHNKYHVLYKGCPIVEIFKSYGFYWGGDWSSTPDAMHLSYIGDGANARSVGIENFRQRR